jgi:argininosuccinate synthase
VRVVLGPGSVTVAGRRSPNALYAETLASYGAGETFPHAAAEGFIAIAALETELAAARQQKLVSA